MKKKSINKKYVTFFNGLVVPDGMEVVTITETDYPANVTIIKARQIDEAAEKALVARQQSGIQAVVWINADQPFDDRTIYVPTDPKAHQALENPYYDHRSRNEERLGNVFKTVACQTRNETFSLFQPHLDGLTKLKNEADKTRILENVQGHAVLFFNPGDRCHRYALWDRFPPEQYLLTGHLKGMGKAAQVPKRAISFIWGARPDAAKSVLHSSPHVEALPKNSPEGARVRKLNVYDCYMN
jgi:hypothetical protein